MGYKEHTESSARNQDKESVPKTNIIKPTSGKYGSNSFFFFYESRIYFLTSVRRAFMDAHLFKEIEETLQSDGVGAS